MRAVEASIRGKKAPKSKLVLPASPALLLPRPKRVALGSAVKNDAQRNCLACSRNPICRDPAKNWNYACSKFNRMPELDMLSLLQENDDARAARAAVIDDAKAAQKEARSGRRRSRRTEINLEQMIEDALSSGFDFPADTRVDDGDLPLAPNFWEWMNSKKYNASTVRLYPKQMQIAMHLLGQFCPRCSDMGFVEDIPYDIDLDTILDRTTWLRHGKCPKCKAERHQLIHSDELREYYYLAACIGQRSGKSYGISAIESYQLHHWLKTPNIHGAFGIGAETELTATYTALTFAQANGTLFKVIRNFITDSPWFKKYHALLDDYGNKLGEDLYHIGEVYFRYKHRRLFGAPSGPNTRTMRGATRFSAVADEIGLMPYGDDNQDNIRMSAEQVFTSLNNAMTTLRNKHARLSERGHNNLPKPLISAVSSPLAVNDYIMQLYNKSKKGGSPFYGMHLPTWEFNPDTTEEGLRRITTLNEQDFLRDFGAQPPLSSSAWIKEVENASSCFGKRPNILKTRSYQFRSKSRALRTSAKIGLRSHMLVPHVITVDAGHVDNSFALATSYYDFEARRVVVDGLAEIQSSDKAPVSFTRVCEEVILPLMDALNGVALVCDQWQSIKLLEDVGEATGAITVQHSCKYKDFQLYRENVYEKKLSLPRLEVSPEKAMNSDEPYPSRFLLAPAAHLLYQIMTVRDVPGKTVTKGSVSTDDLFRAVALANWACLDPDIQQALAAPPVQVRRILGVVRAGNGSGGSVSNRLGASRSRASAGESSSAGSRTVMSRGGNHGASFAIGSIGARY